MRKRPSKFKSFLGAVVLLGFVYFSVYTLSSNEEVVTREIIELPVQLDVVAGKELTATETVVEVEVKGSKEQYKELKERSPYVQLGIKEKEDILEGKEIGTSLSEEELEGNDDNLGEEGVLENSEDTEDDTVEEVSLKEKYDNEITVHGLDGFIYKVLTEVDVNIVEVEGELLELKVRVKGSDGRDIRNIRILEDVTGYLSEADKEFLDVVGVYIDIENLDENNRVVGDIKLIDLDGNEMELEGRVDKTAVEVEVKFAGKK